MRRFFLLRNKFKCVLVVCVCVYLQLIVKLGGWGRRMGTPATATN